MQGKRVELVPQEGGFQSLNPGEYGKWTNGTWYGCTPNDEGCNLGAHRIIEHEDGTITVSPSILVTVSIRDPDNSQILLDSKQLWHGFLEKGIWREC